MNFQNGGFPCLKYLNINKENNENINKDISNERGYKKDININILINNKSTKKLITIPIDKNDELEVV